MDEHETHDPSGQDPGRGPGLPGATVVLQLLYLISQMLLFRSPEGVGYATILLGGAKRTYRILTEAFRGLLSLLYFRAEGDVPKDAALDEAIRQANGAATLGGRVHPVYTRVAPLGEDGVEIDLGDESGQAVVVTPSGYWIDQPTNHFIRPQGSLPLPIPVGGGSVDDLYQFVNVTEVSDQRLFTTCQLSRFLPHGPHVVVQIIGGYGCAKSSTARCSRSLIDPHVAALQGFGRSERDLALAAHNGWLLVGDNISKLSPAISDLLCRISTGGAQRVRKLYSDQDETITHLCNPVMINGISRLAMQLDLIDRTLTFILPSIGDAERRPERDLRRAFEVARPGIFGAFLELLVAVLGELPHVELPSSPRMADFSRLGVACERVLGWPQGSFLAAYEANRMLSIAAVVDDDPVLQAVTTLAHRHGFWHGRASDLMTQLRKLVPRHVCSSAAWPRDARTLSAHLRRNAQGLATQGVELRFDRNVGGLKRVIEVRLSNSSTQGAGPVTTTCGPQAPRPGREDENGSHGENFRIEDLRVPDA